MVQVLIVVMVKSSKDFEDVFDNQSSGSWDWRIENVSVSLEAARDVLLDLCGETHRAGRLRETVAAGPKTRSPVAHQGRVLVVIELVQGIDHNLHESNGDWYQNAQRMNQKMHHRHSRTQLTDLNTPLVQRVKCCLCV